MKSYPSIPTQSKNKNPFQIYYVFDKLDGSNIRAEWNKKRGFYKFCSQTQLIDSNSFILGESVELIQDLYGSELTKRFTDIKCESSVSFFEFHGPNSFAGNHEQEEHQVTLFDISVYKKGFLLPDQFLCFTDGLTTAKLLYVGVIDSTVINQVQSGVLANMTFEGVVMKGTSQNQIVMYKVKNQGWYDKLKKFCGNNKQLYERLK